jgi:hypothetical protein
VPPGSGGAPYITQNACETAGGTWVGPTYTLTDEVHEGSNAFYANSGGCQMCHTHEGYRKRIAGDYDVAGQYSIRYSWSTAAWVGSPSSPAGQNTPLTADVIQFTSPIGCFSCHDPHTVGSPDGQHLDQSIPVGTPITTQTGGVWGSNKADSHICAECHQVRQNANPSTSASILASATGTKAFTVASSYGAHHGPQTDLLLGDGAADYSGAAAGTGGTVSFQGSYSNSIHTTNPNATCVTCHMQSNFEDINLTGRLGVSPAVGGHAFTNKGFVHGAEQVLPLGCGTVVSGVGCHTVAGVTGSMGNIVQAATFATTLGYLQAGDAYFQKSNSPSTMIDSNYQFKVNELLTKLANPSNNCWGLLDAAAIAAGGAHSWTTLTDGFTIDPRCISNGTTKGLTTTPAPGPKDDNTNATVRFLKAIWNFKMVLEDKSFSVHNTRYALEHLYDSCADLAILTGQSCGGNPGRCSFCEGTFVTTRP